MVRSGTSFRIQANKNPLLFVPKNKGYIKEGGEKCQGLS
jgi:hypothetical protein